MTFLFRRSAHSLLLLLLVSALTFAVADLAPGNPLDELRMNPELASETLDAQRARLGLDKPWPHRYLAWLGGWLRGDLGHSFAYGLPVLDLLRPRLGATLLLGCLSTFAIWVVSLILGAWAALSAGGLVDRLVSALESVLLSLPELLLALLALSFAAEATWLPISGMSSDRFGVGRHLLLPVAVLTVSGLASLVSHVRIEIGLALDSPAVAAARGLGVGPIRRFFVYVLPAAANPLISLSGLSLGALLSGSLVVEEVFAWPGIGPLLLTAIRQRDLPLVAASVLMSSALLVLGQLLADVWLHWHDPRVRGNAGASQPGLER